MSLYIDQNATYFPLLATLREWVKKTEGLIVVATDTNLLGLYQAAWDTFFNSLDSEARYCSILPGELSKNSDCKLEIERQLFSMGMQRDGLLIVFGGGVVSDLFGFVAATFMRGISYISIPTSLVGMVDAAIGGKTGINTPWGKNMLGTIYPPEEVLVEESFLMTLPRSEFKEGMSEVIKYSLIKDECLFEEIEGGGVSISRLIKRSIEIKRLVVEIDMYEQGLRRILNFGHTVAHAVETCSDYTISHGAAVWFGMLVESRMSVLLGFLSHEEFDKIESLLLRSDIAFEISEKFFEKNLYQVMKRDKKASHNLPRFVVLSGLGKVETFGGDYVSSFKEELLEDAMNGLRSSVLYS